MKMRRLRANTWIKMLAVLLVMLAAILIASKFAEKYLTVHAEEALAGLLKTKFLDVKYISATNISLLSTPHAIFHNIELYEHGAKQTDPVAVLDRLTIDIALLPLLSGQMEIQKIGIEQATLILQKRPDNSFGITLQKDESRQGSDPFALLLRGASLRILDQNVIEIAKAKHCDFYTAALKITKADEQLHTRLNFNGLLTCAELQTKNSVLEKFSADIAVQEGRYDIAVQAQALHNTIQSGSSDIPSSSLGAPAGQGRMLADFNKPEPEYHFRYQMSGVDVGYFLDRRGSDVHGRGQIDIDLELQLAGQEPGQLKRSMNGHVSINGQDLHLEGIDLDNWLAKIERSQGFDAIDIGAVVLGGPFGLVLTQAYDIASLAHKTPGRSRVKKLVSDWTIKAGIAQARDVAFATEDYQLALFGSINLAEERYETLRIALITPEGCPIIQQKIEGPISKPQIESVSVIKRATAPIVKLLKDVGEALTNKDCDAIYKGAILNLD